MAIASQLALTGQMLLQKRRNAHQNSQGSNLAAHVPNVMQQGLFADLANSLTTCTTPATSQSEPQAEAIKVHPSLLKGMFHQQLAAVGRIWFMLRYLDKQGCGWVDIDEAKQQLTGNHAPLRIVGWRRFRQILQQGRGVFWERDRFGRIWIYGAAIVGRNLKVGRLEGKPIQIPLKSILSGIQSVKANFYSATLASKKTAPISRLKLQELTSVPQRTQRHYDNIAQITRCRNFDVSKPYTPIEGENHAWTHGYASFPFVDYLGKQGRAGCMYTAQRLPNSYKSPLAQSARGRQQKINRRLKDLVNHGVQGNSKQQIDKLFYGDAKNAAKAISKGNDAFLKQTSKQEASDPYSIWCNLT